MTFHWAPKQACDPVGRFRVGHLLWSCQLWAFVQCLANVVPLHICQFVQQYVFAQTNDVMSIVE